MCSRNMYFKHKYVLMYARLAVSGDRTVVQSRKDLVLVERDDMKYVHDVKMVRSSKEISSISLFPYS